MILRYRSNYLGEGAGDKENCILYAQKVPMEADECGEAERWTDRQTESEN